MASQAQLIEAPTEEAQGWLRYSLEQGFDISAAVLEAGFIDRGRGLAIVSDEFQQTPFEFSHGGVIGTDTARECLGGILGGGEFGSTGSILVEDDVQRRGDPRVTEGSEPLAFLGDRVLHWADLDRATPCVENVIHHGAFGYPLNAFLVSKPSADLGLVDRGDAPDDLPQEVVSSLLAVVVAAFDAESFLIWTPDSPSHQP